MKIRWPWQSREEPEEEALDKKDINGKTIVPPPSGRSSIPDNNGTLLSNSRRLINLSGIIEPNFYPEIIPIIRTLVKVNGDMSIAANDMMKLTNTGYRVSFNNSVDKKKAKRMIEHLDSVTPSWGEFNGGMFGIVNKMLTQSFISGALSIEAVIKPDMSGIDFISFVKPETIRFKLDNRGKYSVYQRTNDVVRHPEGYIKLNPQTYIYCSINGDEDVPYGIPPFLSALESIASQKDMKTNIYNIMKLLGILGYLEVLIEKPGKQADENDNSYSQRLTRLLKESKSNIRDGLSDGVMVGFMDDHQYDFKPTTASLQNVSDVYNINQQSLANGLNVAPGIIGLEGNSKTEGGLSIMFTKLLSQLKNQQYFTAYVLKRLFWLELSLNGYDPTGLTVEFNKSTLTDELKHQQGQEIKIRNLMALYDQGIIGQYQFAKELGYSEADKREPRVDRSNSDSSTDEAKKKQEREADKDKSDRKSRESSKGTPKRKDGDTKPV